MPTRIFLTLFLCLAAARASFAQATDAPPSTPTLEAMRARLESLEAQLAKNEIPADAQNAILLKFKIEQAHLWLQKLDSNEAATMLTSPYDMSKRRLDSTLAQAEKIARADGDATYSAVTQIQERAYITNNDGSIQPYWVYVPRGFSTRQKWPLVVLLHGYDPTLSKISPWLPGSTTWQQFTSRGFVLAVPYGRRNSDFVNVGEDDTLAVTREVSARYNIDAERTFLLGPSMGGFGVYAVGLHNPDVFAALAPMCARTDMYLWFHLDRENLPSWKQVLYDADNPRTLARNAFQTPIFFQHGDDDQIVNVENSRRFFADAKALKLPAFYREIPGGSHYIYWDDDVYSIALDWLQKLRRFPTPMRVQFSTGALKNNCAYWVSIEGFEKYDRVASIDAQIKTGNVIEVRAQNVSRFEIAPPREYLAQDKPVQLIVNGIEEKQSYDAAQPMTWPRARDEKLHKTPARCGPIKECYRAPFLVVYGTLQPPVGFPTWDERELINKSPHRDDDEATRHPEAQTGVGLYPALIEDKARRFVKEWDDFADGIPPLKADKDVTEDDKKNYNLVLFGTRESNSILKEISGKLPLELTRGGYRLGDKEYSAKGKELLGAQLCYPSPFSDGRMIVVQSGYYWGSALPVNHKFDLLPEYIVYSDQIDNTDQVDATLQTNHVLAAGFFDDNWQLPKTDAVETAPVTIALPAPDVAP